MGFGIDTLHSKVNYSPANIPITSCVPQHQQSKVSSLHIDYIRSR
jgi:hypothetical protein